MISSRKVLPNLKRQFTLAAQDLVQVSPTTTLGDILRVSLLSSTDEYENKYKDRLEQKAKEQGFSSYKEMLQQQKKAPSPIPPKPNKETPKEKTMFKRSLSDIVNIEKLSKEPSDKIAQIWNEYHSKLDCISGTLSLEFYNKLMALGKKYPVFVLPLPRDSGYEFYMLQFHQDQIYYTSMLEFSTKKDNATPHLVLSHYPINDIVLMRGEVEKPLDASGAQNLVYQTQLFYCGTEKRRELVQKFTEQPSTFDVQDLITSIETLHES